MLQTGNKTIVSCAILRVVKWSMHVIMTKDVKNATLHACITTLPYIDNKFCGKRMAMET